MTLPGPWHGEGGVALVIALIFVGVWSIVIWAILVFAETGFNLARASSDLRDETYAVDAAVEAAIAYLAWTDPDPDTSSFDCPPFAYEDSGDPPTVVEILVECNVVADSPVVVDLAASIDGDVRLRARVRLDDRPPSVATAPEGLTATPGDRAIDVSWEPPADDAGFPVTAYVVWATGASDAPAHQVLVDDPNQVTAQITGLTNDTAYTVSVAAINAEGAGAAAMVAGVTPIHPLSAPQGLAAIPGDGQIEVSWDPPAHDGGSSIAGYVVEAEPGGHAETLPASATSTVVDGLTNGTSYTIAVTATNADGDDSPPATVAGVVPTLPLSEPQDVAAVPGDQQVTVSWEPPADDGGAPVTGYVVAAEPGGYAVPVGPGVASVTLGGLSNGTSYTVGVSARNADGTGPAGTDVATPAGPLAPPSVPLAPAAVPADAAIEVTWAPPDSDGGVPLIGYAVTADPGGHSESVGPGATSMVLVGLTNGTAYSVTVVATNPEGTGPAAVLPGVEPRAGLSGPQDAAAVAGNGQVEVSWSPPGNDGGSAITGYVVSAEPGGHVALVDPDIAAWTLVGLTNGTTYTLNVAATNEDAVGAATVLSGLTPATVPSAPLGLVADPGNTELEVTWSPPASDGGTPLTGYLVTVEPGGYAVPVGPGATSTVVGGLTNAIAHTVGVAAINDLGAGAPAGVSEATPAGVPSAPLDVVAGDPVLDAAIEVTWSPPNSDGGTPLTGYLVTANPGDHSETVDPDVASLRFEGLDNGTEYTVAVTAINAVGAGPAVVVAGVIPAAVPSPPLDVQTTVYDSQLWVDWSPPTNDGGAQVVAYLVSVDGAGPGVLVSPDATSALLTGLANGTTYAASVVAVNVAGLGEAGTALGTPKPGFPALITVLGWNVVR